MTAFPAGTRISSMADLVRRPSPWRYIVATGIVALILVASWFLVEISASRSYSDFAAANRSLQVELARSAMESGFTQILHEGSILASYSFPEFLEGKRTGASIDALLSTELEAYDESLVYALYKGPGERSFYAVREGNAGVLSALDAASRRSWNGLAKFEGPLVEASAPGVADPYFMIFWPVRVKAELKGLLGMSVGFHNSIIKYILPLRSIKGRESFLLAADGRVLWPSGSETPRLSSSSSPSSFLFLSSRGFTLGDEVFTVTEADTSEALKGDLVQVERLRTLVAFVDMVLVGLVVWGGLTFYGSEKRRRRLDLMRLSLSDRVLLTEKELSESETRFKAIFEASFEAIFLIDGEDHIVRYNKRGSDLFGIKDDEVLGRKAEDFAPLLQADGRKSSDVARDAYARARQGEDIILEWSYLGNGGAIHFAEVGIAPLSSPPSTSVVASVRDITERKAGELELRNALDDRELLLRELHHRVKNNLQFLDSLIELQKGVEAEYSQRVLSTVQSRIAALAASYLVASETPESMRINTRDYFGRICSQLRDESRQAGIVFTVELEAEAIPLSLDTAVPLGLILRELLNNAAVHGSTDHEKSLATVKFRRQDSRAELRVSDFGPGLLSMGGEEGLGLTIVRALVRQLSGEIVFEDGKPGLVVRALFPLA